MEENKKISQFTLVRNNNFFSPKFTTDIEKNINYIQNKSVFTEYYFK